MPRDFEYYTGVVFEFQADGSAWGSGGRYTIVAQGEPLTACGLAIEAGLLARHLAPSSPPRQPVAIVPETPSNKLQDLIDFAKNR